MKLKIFSNEFSDVLKNSTIQNTTSYIISAYIRLIIKTLATASGCWMIVWFLGRSLECRQVIFDFHDYISLLVFFFVLYQVYWIVSIMFQSFLYMFEGADQ